MPPVIKKTEAVNALDNVALEGDVVMDLLGGERIRGYFSEYQYKGRTMLLNVVSRLLYSRDTGECLTSQNVRIDMSTAKPIRITGRELSRLLESRRVKGKGKAFSIVAKRRAAAHFDDSDDCQDDDSRSVAAAVTM